MVRVDTVTAWFDGQADASDRLAATLRAAQDAGWRVTLHASDGVQVRCALDCFARAAAPTGPRCGIECRRMPEPSQLAAMQSLGLSLGLTASARETAGAPTEPEHRRADDEPGPPISFGLDTAAGPSSPLRMLQHAIAGAYGIRRTLVQSLAGVTRDAARRCGAGDILGTIEHGKYADFVFLDRDPRAVGAADLAGLRCCGTWVNGVEAFRA